MAENPIQRNRTHPMFAASIEARQTYLAAIRRCDGYLQTNPGDFERQGVRSYLRRALVSEARAIEPYLQPWTEAELREAWGR
jgi:hypothetical protein